MGQLDGKVAFVTGAARGQGRSHARRLAEEGADIIAIDACATQDWLSYDLATETDLAQTVKEVEALDRRIVARRADVRDLGAVRAVVDEGVAALGGRLDIVCANAAIISQPAPTWEMDLDQWRELIDVNLTGVFVTVKAAIPQMIAAGNGGSIWDIPMIQNEALYRSFRPDLDNPGREDVKEGFRTMNLLPIPWVEPVDISNAIVWLASDAARYVTGVTLPVDAGNALK